MIPAFERNAGRAGGRRGGALVASASRGCPADFPAGGPAGGPAGCPGTSPADRPWRPPAGAGCSVSGSGMGTTVGDMDPELRAATNQAPPLVGDDVVSGDAALREALLRHGSPEVLDSLRPLGLEAGTAEAREHGMLANENPPRLRPYDRWGERVDEVTFHPSWHWLMERAVGYGLAATPWESDDPHAHVRRAAGFFAWSQTEPGHGCPISMTYAAVPALRADDAIAKEWLRIRWSCSARPLVARSP